MTQHPDIAETVADGAVHLTGIVLSVFATVLLILHVAQMQSGLTIAATSLYGAAIVFSFIVSGVYNLWPWRRMRETLRRVDHAAIFLKIAGTYTPLVVVIGSMFGYITLGIIWAIALTAAASKLIFAHWPKKLSLATYLLLGWAALILIVPMVRTLDTAAVILIALGGALYSLGTIFYVWEKLRYQTAIWHGFVLAASACFFGAIALSV